MVFSFPALMKIQWPVFSLSKANIYNSILEYLLIGKAENKLIGILIYYCSQTVTSHELSIYLNTTSTLAQTTCITKTLSCLQQGNL